MPKYSLGQQISYNAYMFRHKSERAEWRRFPLSGSGIIVGKRTVSDGYTEYWPDEGYQYKVTKYHNFWLVAHNLAGYRYVAEDDIREPAP